MGQSEDPKKKKGQSKDPKPSEDERRMKNALERIDKLNYRLRDCKRSYDKMHVQRNEIQAQRNEFQERYQLSDKKLKDIHRWLEKVKQSPLNLYYLVEKSATHAVITDSRMSSIARISLPPAELNLPEGEPGRGVWVIPEGDNIIMEDAPFEMPESIGRVVDIFDGKAVIEDAGLRAILKDTLRDAEIGDTVTYLPIIRRMTNIIRKGDAEKLLAIERPDVTWGQIGGLDKQIERIRDLLELPLKAADTCKKYNLRMPRGCLLHGPPGCGKTMMAKALANEIKAAFMSITTADILSKWVGDSEAMMKSAFHLAKKHAPSVMFFDEIDVLGRTRGRQDTSGVHKNIVGQMLAEMDGFTNSDGVVVFAATNRREMVDAALLRPGRFDEQIKIPRPTRAAAEAIFRIHLPDALPLDKKLHSISRARSEVLHKMYDYKDKKGYPRKEYGQIVSGALFEGIATRAKRKAVKREVAERGVGMALDHVMDAFEEMTREMTIETGEAERW